MKTFLSKYGNAIWIALLIPACIIAFFQGAHSIQAAPIQLAEGMTMEWSKGGWVFNCSLTDTGTKAGTTMTLEATGTYTRDGVEISTDPVTVTLTVGDSEIQKKWVTTTVLPNMKVVDVTGNGGAEIGTDGKLTWWVKAKNDGTTQNFSFKLVPTATAQ